MGKHRVASRIFSDYKYRAKKKGLEFSIAFEHFIELLLKHCYLCGSPPKSERFCTKQSDSFVYNGLDRINAARGYVTDNVRPCCHRCNWIKMDSDLDDLKTHLEKMVSNL